MDVHAEENLQGGSGCVVALLIGFFTIGAVSVSHYLLNPAIGHLYRDQWGYLLFQSLIVAAPFGFFALTGVGKKSIWIAALVLTAVFWGLIASGALEFGGVGANIGLGWLMIASPLGIAAGAAALVSAVGRLRRK